MRETNAGGAGTVRDATAHHRLAMVWYGSRRSARLAFLTRPASLIEEAGALGETAFEEGADGRSRYRTGEVVALTEIGAE